jgi:ATP/maltotriose-dependent transcriptional regulator MalT
MQQLEVYGEAEATSAPEQAVELLAWVCSSADLSLNWVRHWPLFDRIQSQLHAAMGSDAYHRHWEKGTARTVESITTSVHQAFRAPSDARAQAAHHQFLTAREHEILGLLAAGMTNPQIAAQLVIGAGTVKTHTLNIYRKLEVANRTQAIVGAQALGFLHA